MMTIFNRLRRSLHGGAAVVFTLATPILLGAVSLAVDTGWMTLEQTRLQGVADAAVLAGVQKLATPDLIYTNAQAVAEQNLPGQGSSVVPASAVERGIWNAETRTFTATAVNPNAIRVTAKRTSANGNAFPLLLGAIIGIPTADISASSIAIGATTCTPVPGFNYISNFVPIRAAVVTMGETDPRKPDRKRYLATPDYHPIIRVDSSLDMPALITISISGRADQRVTTPGKGSFWTALTDITVTEAANPDNADVVLVHKVKSSVPSQPFNAGSTATWNNNLRTTQLPGTAICEPGTARTVGKLVT